MKNRPIFLKYLVDFYLTKIAQANRFFRLFRANLCQVKFHIRSHVRTVNVRLRLQLFICLLRDKFFQLLFANELIAENTGSFVELNKLLERIFSLYPFRKFIVIFPVNRLTRSIFD